MGKVWTYVFISIGLMMVLHFAGFPTGVTGTVFNTIGLKAGIDASGNQFISNVTTTDSTLYNKVFRNTGDDLGVLILLGTGLIIAGLLTKSKPENLILLPVILVLLAFVSAYYSLMVYVIGLGQQWAIFIMTLIFLPITVGFIIALAEFFRGTD